MSSNLGREGSSRLPSLHPVDLELELTTLCDVISSVWPAYGNVEVSHEEIALDSIISVISTVAEERFTRAQQLHGAYERSGITSFLPASCEEEGENVYFISPIIERNVNGNLMLDGVHRCLSAYKAGETRVIAAIISPEHDDIPFVGPTCALTSIRASAALEARRPLYSDKKNSIVRQYFRPGSQFAELTASRLA